MELHQLRYFLAVVETGSFSQAARAVHVAQPSLSQQIAKLEQELGQVLFDRLPRRVVLTQAGADLRDHARRILREVHDAGRRLAEHGAEVGGRLVVGAIPTLGPYVLPALLGEFCRAYPQVAFEIIEEPTGGLVERLERGEVDLALTSAGKGGSAIRFERVAREELVLMLPCGHALANATNAGDDHEVRWNQLEGENFLVLQDLHCLTGQTLRFCDAGKIRPRVVVRASQLETLATLAATGLGISLVPALMAKAGLSADLCTRRFARPRPTRDLAIATNTGHFQTRATREFVALARRRLPTLAGSGAVGGN